MLRGQSRLSGRVLNHGAFSQCVSEWSDGCNYSFPYQGHGENFAELSTRISEQTARSCGFPKLQRRCRAARVPFGASSPRDCKGIACLMPWALGEPRALTSGCARWLLPASFSVRGLGTCPCCADFRYGPQAQIFQRSAFARAPHPELEPAFKRAELAERRQNSGQRSSKRLLLLRRAWPLKKADKTEIGREPEPCRT